jgi:hypothetical protein
VPVPAQRRPGEIVVFQTIDPSSPAFFAQAPISSADFAIDVFGCDRRLALVCQHYFVRAQWFNDWHDGIEGFPEILNTPGEGLVVTVAAIAIARTHDGGVVELGPLSDAYWLAGGSAPDGIEIVSGMDGVRLKFHLDASVLPGSAPSYWNLVANVEAKPNTRIGCGEVVAEIAENLQIVLPGSPAQYQSLTPPPS